MRQIKRLSDDEELQMVEEYRQGISSTVLMKKYGFATQKSITDKIKKHYPDSYKQIISEGRNNKKNYEIDITEINSEFVAYFIGLMLSDGYIQDENRFGLQLTDEDAIKFISEITGKNYKTYSYHNDNRKTFYRIIFSSKEQVEKLKRYGITERKSKIIPALELKASEEKYLPYLIRGLLDGDGCIYYTSKITPSFFIVTASKNFADWIKETLENKLYMKDVHISVMLDQYYRVETAYYPNLLKLLALVYDKPFGMSRKYELIRKMFRDYNGNLLTS